MSSSSSSSGGGGGESLSRPSLARDESFVKGVFGGIVLDGILFPYPEAGRAEADDVHAHLDAIRRLAMRSVDGARIDREEAIDAQVLEAAREAGLFGLVVPKAHGGAGLGMTAYCRVVQELGYVDASLALVVSAHQSLGVAALTYFGSEEMQTKWLPRLSKGTSLAAFALVEHAAGSDAGSIQTRAERDGDGYVISGEKIWVTNGANADLFTVFARTSPAEDGAKPRLTAFLVERGAGVTIGADEPKLGVRGARTATISFDKVRVPAEHVLGDVGRGFKVAMEVLTSARLSLAASCVGIGKRLLKMSVDRATERKAFGRTISEFGLVKDKLAVMSSELFAMESMTYMTTGLVDQGRTDFAVESAISKVFTSEALWRVANEALQIGGGIGYMRSAGWERLLRDARHAMVYEGTNEILRAFIALSGMQNPGREIEDVSKAMREPIKGFGLLSDLAIRKARSVLSRERERMTKAHPMLAAHAARFDENTGHLARHVEKALRRHGKNIAEMQYTQKRTADVAIDLYAIASCLSRTTRAIDRRGEEGARREIDLTTVFVASAEKRIAANITAFDDNDDELRKVIANKTCADGGYPLDVI
jgi:acyl-CoA dehydrogenase family member 9